jgi:hypothetical protein
MLLSRIADSVLRIADRTYIKHHLQKNKTVLACWPEVLAVQQHTTCGSQLSAIPMAFIIIQNIIIKFNKIRTFLKLFVNHRFHRFGGFLLKKTKTGGNLGAVFRELAN